MLFCSNTPPSLLLTQKRFYTRRTLLSIRNPRLTRILTIYRDWLRAIELYRREGGGVKTFTVVHTMQRYLLIYSKISFASTLNDDYNKLELDTSIQSKNKIKKPPQNIKRLKHFFINCFWQN